MDTENVSWWTIRGPRWFSKSDDIGLQTFAQSAWWASFGKFLKTCMLKEWCFRVRYTKSKSLCVQFLDY